MYGYRSGRLEVIQHTSHTTTRTFMANKVGE